MQRGDRLVCCFVEQTSAGQQFKDWPLHLTIVPWFRLAESSRELALEIQDKLGGIGQFSVVMGKDDQFGYRRSKTVSLVQEPAILHEVESRVRAVLKSHGAWLVDETTKKRRSFRPHVTAQAQGRLRIGDSFMVDKLFIVEQMGGYKEVVSEIELEHEATP